MVSKILIYALAIFMVIAVILPLIRKDHWTFRVFEFPRVQKLTLTVLTLVLAYFFLPHTLIHYLTMGILVLIIIHLVYLILPFTILASKSVKGISRKKAKDPFKLLISNVYQPNSDYSKLVSRIKRHEPDLVFLVETDDAWKKGIREIESLYPYTIFHPMDNTYGLLLYSKLELVEHQIRYLVEEDIPSIKAKVKSPAGGEILFFGLHPEPPFPTENPYSTDRDTELLLVARECELEKQPTLVIGDMNDVAWSYTTERFLNISGLLDLRKGRGIFPTFHAKNILMRWPLDHIFCSPHFKLIRMKRLKRIGSDHFPVLVELSLEC